MGWCRGGKVDGWARGRADGKAGAGAGSHLLNTKASQAAAYPAPATFSANSRSDRPGAKNPNRFAQRDLPLAERLFQSQPNAPMFAAMSIADTSICSRLL